MLDKVRTFLILNNINCEYIDNGNSRLKFEILGLSYLAEFNKTSDGNFFRILLPNVGDMNNEKITDLINYTSIFKCGKLLIVNNYIWLAVETFIYGQPDIPQMVARMIQVLQDMYNSYLENL